MNANELIETCKDLILSEKLVFEACEGTDEELRLSIEMNDIGADKLGFEIDGEIEHIKRTREKCKRMILIYESLLSELSRTRIRETATKKPTEADGNKYGYLLAHNFRTDEWEKVFYMHIADTDETSYDKWTHLPEVTP